MNYCEDTEERRIDCPCEKCSEWRECLKEKFWDEMREENWDRNEQSRRVDQEYVRRRM